MTKEELKEEIIELLFKPINCKMFSDVWLEHKADQILTLIRESGVFMDTEMVKGLMFEVQAKKCSQCLKNREEKDYEWECEMQHRKEQSETP